MENKQGNSYTEWFTVLKVPILKITIGDQVFFFSLTRRINTPGELFKVLKEDAWRIIDAEKPYQANFYETARLFDYFSGQEVPISIAVLTAEAGWKQHREKTRQLPIQFHVTLHDKIWNKEKEITSQGLIEIYRVKAEVRIAPSQGIPGYRQEAIIEGKKLVRLYGLFATDNEPFTPEDDPILKELFKQVNINSEVPRIKRRGDKKNLSGYMDITFFLKE
ncbi:MAG: hypothetical protein QXW42_06330 [Thermofilum sp.]|uniref:Uncharacterized protein n=2 Tax=Thermofilum TaxID=2268 RepID=A0A3G1A5C8_9CREN|nr:hypothetical protein [Thermofilum adornatum]AJB42000.1 hypothetical protein TCARB_0950 [Thermofilum adornatum 1505]